jgi:hypothetical protein
LITVRRSNEAPFEYERRMLETVEGSKEAADEVTWEAASGVIRILPGLFDSDEEGILGYKAVWRTCWSYRIRKQRRGGSPGLRGDAGRAPRLRRQIMVV